MSFRFTHIDIQQRHLVLLLSFAIIAGLIYSPFLLSNGMLGFIVIALIRREGFKLIWNEDFILKSKTYFNNKALLSISIFFLIVLLGVFQNEDWSYWGERIRLKLPFILFPFFFWIATDLSKRDYRIIWYFLIGILTISCIYIGINYAMHFNAINQSIAEGQHIPTPRNHIRFSLLLALGIIAAFHFYVNEESLFFKFEKKLLLVCGISLLGFIHLLAVRSGLFALYAALGILIPIHIIKYKKYIFGALLLAAMIATPIASYYALPSLQKKVNYMMWEMQRIQAGEKADDYSDAGRLLSWKIGMEIGNRSPIIGVGAGNLRKEVRLYYQNQGVMDIDSMKMPHNQFISIYAGSGIIGLGLFLFALFYPFFKVPIWKNPLALGFFILSLGGFIVENTIENSIGIGFFIYFWSIFIAFPEKSKTL